jgi:hypothetical protein
VDLEKGSGELERGADVERLSSESGVTVAEGEESGGGGEGGGGSVMSRVVSRVLTRGSTKSWNPGPPPDGGVKAWTAGESSFWMMIVVRGVC